MKILAIIGSSKQGNTTELVKYFESRLREHDPRLEFEHLYLGDHPINFCIGCHSCILLGEEKCPDSKNVKMIEDKIMDSDGLVLASPGYMFSVTGIMKNFLDHVAYNCHRPKYFGKKAYLLSAANSYQEKGVFIPMETWVSAAGFELAGKAYGEMLPFPLKEKKLNGIRKKITKSAADFYRVLKDKRPVAPDFGGVMVFYAFRTLCSFAPNILRADYEYFKRIDAYHPATKWFTTARISYFRIKLARFIERMMKKQLPGMVELEKLEGHRGIYRNKL